MTDVSKSRDQQLAATLAAIEYTGPTDIQVYTDGSTHVGTTDGGAGMVAMSGEDIIERPMEQLVPSGEISDSESNLVARWVRLAIGVGALRQQVPGQNPCEL